MTQFAQRLGFDLANSLPGYLERLPNLFQRVLRAVFETEAHLDDALFARREGAQHLRGVLLEIDADNGFRGRNCLAVFNEVAEVRIFFFADRSLERDGLLRDLQDLADLGDRDVHATRYLLAGRLAAQFLHQLAAGADEFVDGLDHVHRDTNRPGL